MNYELNNFRLTCYRRLYFQDPTVDDSIQDLHRVWQESGQMLSRCLSAIASPGKSGTVSCDSTATLAEYLLTAFLCLQTGLRNYEPLNAVIDSAYSLLPRLRDARLRLHLLVHLYGETEDPALRTEIATLLKTFRPQDEEDRYLLQTYHAIEESIH